MKKIRKESDEGTAGHDGIWAGNIELGGKAHEEPTS